MLTKKSSKLPIRLFHLFHLSIIAVIILLLPIRSYAQTSDPGKESNIDQKTISQDSGSDNSSSNKSETTGDSKTTDNKNINIQDETKKAEKIEATLEYGIQKDRKAAINMINTIRDEQLRKRLIQKLESIIENDSDLEIKRIAITTIGDNKSESSAPALIKALDDSSEDIKIAACYALGKIKADSAKQRLVELFNSQNLKSDSNYTEAIIITLTDLKAPDILETAVTAVKSRETTKSIRERLFIYIGQAGSAAQKDVLLEVYKDDDEDISMRSYAIRAISKLKLKEATDDIKAIIKEIDSYPFAKKKKYYDLHMYSVTALVEMGDTDSLSLLMNSLRSDNTTTRLKAVNLIKDFSDERTIDILKYKMQNDPSPKVRTAARKALEDKGIIEKSKDDSNLRTDIEREEIDD
ncbi:MAG: HEAT repeat domain-containing protein [Leptospirales bacterium]|nr:HEAT repeat domain-containing protein [Leptospirales bacterium]